MGVLLYTRFGFRHIPKIALVGEQNPLVGIESVRCYVPLGEYEKS
jgi:hypothetical protein